LTEPFPALFHYSAAPLGELRPVTQEEQQGYVSVVEKPRGLWLSVDDEWATWCTETGFRLHDLAVRTRIVLKHPDHLLWLKTPAQIRAFQHQYEKKRPGSITYFIAIDWPRVAADHAGILIAPYQWSLRNDLMWYYGWDCASGCLWDTSIIDRVEP
jgi:hypothetical protein